MTTIPAPVAASAIVAGRFTATTPTDDVLIVVQQPIAHGFVTFTLQTDAHKQPDGSVPIERDQIVPALTDPATFDANHCAVFLTGDLDGDGVDELIGVQSCDAPGVPPRLLVLHTAGLSSELPVDVATELYNVRSVARADLDADGRPDLVIVFAGDPATCVSSSCTPAGNGVVVLWGAPGGLSAPTVLPAVPGSGAQASVAALNLDQDPQLELAVATTAGVFAFHVQPDRSVQVMSASPLIAFDGSSGILAPPDPRIAAGDLDADGVTDLVVNDRGAVHVLLGVATGVAEARVSRRQASRPDRGA
jgi:hypothetical protein